MMKKLMLLAAGGVGYVLGAKAGRERYEQIKDSAQKIRKNPTVQQKMDEAKTKAQEAAGTATDKVRHKAGAADQSSTMGSGPTGMPTGTSPTAPAGFGQGDEGL